MELNVSNLIDRVTALEQGENTLEPRVKALEEGLSNLSLSVDTETVTVPNSRVFVTTIGSGNNVPVLRTVTMNTENRDRSVQLASTLQFPLSSVELTTTESPSLYSNDGTPVGYLQTSTPVQVPYRYVKTNVATGISSTALRVEIPTFETRTFSEAVSLTTTRADVIAGNLELYNVWVGSKNVDYVMNVTLNNGYTTRK